MAEYRYSISLRVFHPTMDLAAVADVSGLAPSASWKVGEPRRTPTGQRLPGTYSKGFWVAQLLKGSSVDRDLPAALGVALDMIAASADLIGDVTRSGGRAELFVGWFFDEGNSGDVLDHRLLARLAAMNLDLSFDVHP